MTSDLHNPRLPLNDGHEIESLIYGTSGLQGTIGMLAVRDAIRAGWRTIDTAQRYNNEMSVGMAIKESGVRREEITVISKIHGANHGLANVRPSIIDSLRKLDLDVIDLMLIHWPNPTIGLAIETWMALIDAKADGLVRSIGVSNFANDQLDELIEATWVAPAVNQIPIDPWSQQVSWREHCHQRKVMPMAWSPSGFRAFKEDQVPAMVEMETIAKNHDATVHQIALAWHRHQGHVAVSGSTNEQRRAQNFASLGIELTGDELDAIANLRQVTKHTDRFHPHQYEEW
ncbi:aldo/keto reductase [Stomatohabitans albus]|uniref:aldo/keto reductase n=1 Tax=Stomatohabitans albus TaxID=3110766 RepID=UPI00300D616B